MWFHDPSFYSEHKVREGIRLLKEYGSDIQIKRVFVLLNDETDLFVIDI